jgi:hypothetical protein
MTPRAQKLNPTAGALRASRAIQNDASLRGPLPEVIDRETGVREILEILQSIIAQAGDLIESRNPELVAVLRSRATTMKRSAKPNEVVRRGRRNEYPARAVGARVLGRALSWAPWQARALCRATLLRRHTFGRCGVCGSRDARHESLAKSA